MRSRELWLSEGLTVLAELGFERLTIEMLFIQPLDAVPEGMARLERLISDVLDAEFGRPRLEAAVRLWATADPEAQALLTRVDDVRLDFFRQQFEAMGLAQHAATEYATLGLLFSIGAMHVQPTPPRDRITALWQRLIAAAKRESPAADARPATSNQTAARMRGRT